MSKLQQIVSLALSVLVCIVFFSCDNDSFIQSTGTDGRPSVYKDINGKTLFGLFYQGARLTSMKRENGSSTEFTYGDRSLLRVSFNPEHGVADGHASTDFQQVEDNKIRIESSGEPSFTIHTREMELDDLKRPRKVTDLGYFEWDGKEMKQVEDGETYALFSYNPDTELLYKIKVFGLADGALRTTCTFSYELSPGTMSQVDLPEWFRIYWIYWNSYDLSPTNLQFLNYKNNLREINIENANGTSSVVSFQYMYNKNNYPLTVSSSNSKDSEIRIQY